MHSAYLLLFLDCKGGYFLKNFILFKKIKKNFFLVAWDQISFQVVVVCYDITLLCMHVQAMDYRWAWA